MPTILRIPVSEQILDDLQRQAQAQHKEIESLVVERLPQLVQANSVKPIVIADEDRRKLEAILGKNLSSPAELISIVGRALDLTVNEAHVQLTPHLLDRLKSRCFGMEFHKFIEFTVKRGLEEFCGLR